MPRPSLCAHFLIVGVCVFASLAPRCATCACAEHANTAAADLVTALDQRFVEGDDAVRHGVFALLGALFENEVCEVSIFFLICVSVLGPRQRALTP